MNGIRTYWLSCISDHFIGFALLDGNFLDRLRSAYLVAMNSIGNFGFPAWHTFKTFRHKGLAPGACRR